MARCSNCGGTGGFPEKSGFKMPDGSGSASCLACGGTGSSMMTRQPGELFDGVAAAQALQVNPTDGSAAEAGWGTREGMPNGEVHPATAGSRSGMDQVGAGPSTPLQSAPSPVKAPKVKGKTNRAGITT